MTKLPDNITEEQWIEFSNIQCASYLIIDEESLERCRQWMRSGDDDDAWS